MRKDKTQAFVLRKQGKSYREIREALGIPSATLSNWFASEPWSRSLSKRLNKRSEVKNTARIISLNAVRGENLKRLYDEAKKEAIIEFELLKDHPLFVSGVMIYWGEGDKISKNGFRIANSDPVMIRLFFRFLKDVCNAPPQRIRASLLLYPDLEKNECLEYWSKKTGLTKESFAKSTVIQGRSKVRRLNYGTCTLYFPSRFLKEKMLVWIDLLPKYLLE